MKKTCRLLIIILITLVATEASTEAQSSIFDNWKSRRIERKMSGNKRKAPKEKKIKEPRSVIKAKKKQEKRQDELKKAYEKSLGDNKERHFNIQTEEVKERMKQNERDIKSREKERRKAIRKAGRKARKKYK